MAPYITADLATKSLERIAEKRSSGGNNLYLNAQDISEKDGARVTPVGGDSVTGYLVWINKKKLVFSEEPSREDIAQRADDSGIGPVTGKERIAQFFGLFVWNYKAEAVQYFEFGQTSLVQPFLELMADEEIGSSPEDYDWKLSVNRSGDFPQYNIQAVPGWRRKPEYQAKIQDAWDTVAAKGGTNGPNCQVALMGGDVFTGTVKACGF